MIRRTFFLFKCPTKAPLFSWVFTFICTDLKAYWYSLWTSRWKMSHFLSLVMVINSLSIDPECLNLPQKYLTIYMAPFLSFVSSTSKETPEWRKKWWYFLDRKQLSCKFPFCYIQKNEKESKCKLGLLFLSKLLWLILKENNTFWLILIKFWLFPAPVHRWQPSSWVPLFVWPSSQCWDWLPDTNLRDTFPHCPGNAAEGQRSRWGKRDDAWREGKCLICFLQFSEIGWVHLQSTFVFKCSY